jgi:hypothetical protein
MQFSGDYEIFAATNFEEIEAIRPIWEQMQRDEPHPVPNADIDRYLSVVKTSGDDVRPHIMVMKCDGHPVAITICKNSYKDSTQEKGNIELLS